MDSVSFQVCPIQGIPLIREGDNLAEYTLTALRERGEKLSEGDIVVYSSKLVSKAEGRIRDLNKITPSERADTIASRLHRDPRLIQLIIDESESVLGEWRSSLIVRDIRGMVCVNAGIDKSNIYGDTRYCLLPVDPFRSAATIHREMIMRSRLDRVGVVLVDSSTRPFRRGLTHYTLGYAGVVGFHDYRGEDDLYGRRLRVKVLSVADGLACAAGLCMGEGCEKIGAALIRGLDGHVLRDSPRERLTTGSDDIFDSLYRKK